MCCVSRWWSNRSRVTSAVSTWTISAPSGARPRGAAARSARSTDGNRATCRPTSELDVAAVVALGQAAAAVRDLRVAGGGGGRGDADLQPGAFPGPGGEQRSGQRDPLLADDQ